MSRIQRDPVIFLERSSHEQVVNRLHFRAFVKRNSIQALASVFREHATWKAVSVRRAKCDYKQEVNGNLDSRPLSLPSRAELKNKIQSRKEEQITGDEKHIRHHYNTQNLKK